LGSRDPQTKRFVLDPKRTLPTAEAYVREFHSHKDGRTLHLYQDQLIKWRGNHYAALEHPEVKGALQNWLHHEVLRVRGDGDTATLVDFLSNPVTVNAAFETIRNYVYLPAAVEAPCWLDHRTDPPAHELIPCRSLTLHVPSGRILQPTPALFNVNALDFDYDAGADEPLRWMHFLHELFGEDRESINLLAEWFGYCLTGDTSKQKMLLIVGPRRSGKGTIGRALTHLVGAGNVANPTTSSLAGNFGLQPLIGKSLAMVSDARFAGESTPIVIERRLNISGEDPITIDRKFLPSVSLRLPTRFVFLANELPRLSDASTALAGRFLILRHTNSFFGREDSTLGDQLCEELPGILLWAIEGWKRLRQRGRFQQPQSAAEAIRELEDLSSPVGAFVRQECIVAVGRRIEVDPLYAGWKKWCEQEGRTSPGTKQHVGRELTAAAPGVKRRRGTDDRAFYEGIDLR
jgi:putative DNA primase/helicase